jgi:serine protease
MLEFLKVKYLTTRLILIAGLLSETVTPLYSATLNNGIAVNNLSSPIDSSLAFEIFIPTGASNLKIEISGSSGDADLYVKAGNTPTDTNYDCRPYLYGSSESCLFASPTSTTYYIKLNAYESFSNVSLLATFDSGATTSTSTELHNGVSLTDLSQTSGQASHYQISVPVNATDLEVTIHGGSGDADLYVRSALSPTTSSYDCRSYQSGNNESCSFGSPAPGIYHIMLQAYTSYSGVNLTVSYSDNTQDDSGATWSEYESYYSGAVGQTGSNLISALEEAASRNQTHLSYSQVWDALKYTDEDPEDENRVILIYTGRSQEKSFNASGNNDPDAWNREHTWPKSHGFPSTGDWGYTDIHHLRPADASVNSSRGNKDFDNGGDPIDEAPGNFTDSDSFEPRDEIKGDIARMMFYMDIRYSGQSHTGTDDLTLVDYTDSSGASLGDLCTLYEWHNQDPVSTEEITRHGRIVERQGNRNPFVDNPVWVNEIWGGYCH